MNSGELKSLRACIDIYAGAESKQHSVSATNLTRSIAEGLRHLLNEKDCEN
jgi:hypothetical protein